MVAMPVRLIAGTTDGLKSQASQVREGWGGPICAVNVMTTSGLYHCIAVSLYHYITALCKWTASGCGCHYNQHHLRTE